MLPLSPALFLASARALVGSDVRTTPGIRSKRMRLAQFDPVRREDHAPQDGVTTAAFIGHVGYWSHYRGPGNSSWPFPIDADCRQLAHIGKELGVLNPWPPNPGAIHLRWSERYHRFVRASVVLRAAEVPPRHRAEWHYACDVLEGALVRSSPAEGGEENTDGPVATIEWVRERRLISCPWLGDRFLSWVELDARNPASATHPVHRVRGETRAA